MGGTLRQEVLPYRAQQEGDLPRPLLALTVRGINDESGNIWGIVDSGADCTSLPFEYAALMGYDDATLKCEQGLGAGGAIEMYRALKPAKASVVGWEDIEFELWPDFTKGSEMPLWGRADFFGIFIVTFIEESREFVLGIDEDDLVEVEVAEDNPAA